MLMNSSLFLVLMLMCNSSLFAQVKSASFKILKGQWVQGGLVIGQTTPGIQFELGKQKVAVTSDGVFSLGFDRDAPTSLTLLVIHPDGRQVAESLSIKSRDYNIQRIEGISKAIMSPSDKNLKRIRDEAGQVWSARSKIKQRNDFAGEFTWPLTGPITGVYGSQRLYNNIPKRPHYGVDVAAPTGTPLSTPAPGVVTLAHKGMFYSGGTIIIDHGYGVSSTLMHLSKVLVKVGDEVKPGDIIAEVGATGRATGPHLDWRMNWYQSRIDPQLLVGAMPVANK
jgi:biotin carboxyl carrier protein